MMHTGNWRKLQRYWNKVKDPYYYKRVSSFGRSPLADVSPSIEDGRAGYDNEFTTTSRILNTARTLAKQTDNYTHDE